MKGFKLSELFNHQSGDLELIEPNYEGVSKVLSEFEKLYKVCDNKELLDECLKSVFFPYIKIKE